VKVRPGYCKHCGQRIGSNDRLCIRCGQLIPDEEFESDASHAAGPAVVDLTVQPDKPTAIVPVSLSAEVAEPSALEHTPSPPHYVTAGAVPPGYVRERKSSFPVLEVVVAVLLLAGAATSIWIFRSTLPARRLEPPPILVTIDPSSARVLAGKSLEFAATVSGSEIKDVTWSVKEGASGGRVVAKGAQARADGKVAALATYTAPRKAGVYHLLAMSNTNPPSAVTAEITVVRK
jgi:hypothetical protein